MATLRVVIAGDARDYGRALQSADKNTERFERGITRATGTVHGLGGAYRTLGGLIAAAGVAHEIRQFGTAQAESEVSSAKLTAQLKQANISYQAHGKEIDSVIQKTSKLAGLDDEDLQDAFTAIVRTSGSVSESLRGTAIAADLARAKHMDVTKAGELVAKVAGGNVGILSRYGVSFDAVTTAQDKLKASAQKYTPEQLKAAQAADKQATSQKALGVLQSRFAGQAEAYGKTSAGAYDRLGVASENLQESLGGILAPAVSAAADGLAGLQDAASHIDFSGATNKVRDWAGDIGGFISDTRTKIDHLMHPKDGKQGASLASAIGTSIADGVSSIDWSTIGSTISTGIEGGLDLSAELPGAIEQGLSSAMSQVDGRQVLGKLVDVIGQAGDALFSPSFWKDHIVGILSTIELVIPAGKILKLPGFGFLQRVVTDNFNKLAVGFVKAGAGAGGKIVTGFLRGLDDVAPGAAKVLRKVLVSAPQALASLPGKLGLAGGVAAGRFLDALSKVPESIGGVLGKGGGRAYNAAQKLGGSILHGLGSVGTALFNLGKTLIGRLASGIAATPGKVFDSIKGAVGKIPGIDKLPFGNTGGRLTARGFRRYAAGGIAAFAAGGLVPAMVSPGELLAYGGQTAVVPGARVAADNVFTMLPAGTEVYTDSGQQMLAAGHSRAEALRMQTPHFAKGGVVTGASMFGGPGDSTTKKPEHGYRGDLLESYPNTWAELGRNGGVGNALGGLPYKTKITIGYRGRTAVAEKRDIGSGGGPVNGHPRTIDLYYHLAQKLGFSGLGVVTYTLGGSSKDLAASVSGDGRTLVSAAQPATYKTVLGDRYQGDALTAGFNEGLDGRTRISNALLGSITAGGIGKREQASAAKAAVYRSASTTAAAGRPSAAPSGSGGVGTFDGKPVADWIIPILTQARGDGTSFRVSSGFRSLAEQTVLWNRYGHDREIVAAPGTSNHEGSKYPRGAVDIFPGWQNMVGWLGKHPSQPLKHYGSPRDPYHFSATGHRRGGIVGFAKGGRVGKVAAAKALSAKLWGGARGFYPGAGKGQPPTSWDRTSGAGGLFPGTLYDKGGARRGRSVTWPSFMVDMAASSNDSQRSAFAETAIHEWAHYFQAPRVLASNNDDLIEGGAQAFTRQIAPFVFGSLGLPFSVSSRADDTYLGPASKVHRKLGNGWIRHGQFTNSDRTPIANFARGGLVGGRPRAMRGGGTIDIGTAFYASSKSAGGDQSLAHTIAAILDAAATEKKETMAAFTTLRSILGDGMRTTFATLSQVIRTSTASAARERAGGNKVDARRLEAVANIARAQQGIRIARPIIATQKLADEQQHDTTVLGLKQRVGGIDPSSLSGIDQSRIQDIFQIGDLEDSRDSLKTALARAKRVKNTKAIAEVSKALTALDDTLLEKRADLAELERQLPQQLVREDMGRYTSKLGRNSLAAQAASFTLGGDDDRAVAGARRGILANQEGELQRAIAGADQRGDTAFADELIQQLSGVRDELHTLDSTLRYSVQNEQITAAETAQVIAQVDTPGDTSDDIAALNSELSAATAAYQAARASGDTDAIKQYGQEIIGLRGSIESLTQATQSQTAALQAANDLLRQQLDASLRAQAIAESKAGTLAGALVDYLNGQIVGTGLRGRNATAGSGSVVRN